MNQATRSLAIAAATAVLGLAAQSAQAQRMSGDELIRALQEGGYVLVMNQAHAEVQTGGGGRGGFGGGFGGGRGGFGGGGGQGGGDPVPTLTNDSENMLIGARHAIWHFEIPIGAVYTSTTRAAVQQADEVPFAEITEVEELTAEAADSGWLAARLMEPPMADSNTIIVSHAPNIENDLDVPGVGEGETLVVRPGEDPAVVGRLNLRDWSVLATELEP